MSLLIQNENTPVFIALCTRTYSPHKIAYIVTSRNVPYFFYSSATVFLYFLKDHNVSGYLVVLVVAEALYDNYFSSRTQNTALCHTLQHLLQFTHTSTTYAQTSFRNSLLTNDIPTYVWSYIHIPYVSCIYSIPNYFTLSISLLNLLVQTLSFMAHSSIRTNIIVIGSSPRWEKITSDYHNYLLKGLNLRYMHCSQKHFAR